ncbi:hypothetical protein [Leptothoe sp. PORK10 BA2]|uniref:hypothetical protein n=1 Tax=Leptothoe sp. PORK10 BA2 TaxID=3110254 RepID=UPI002B1EEBF9|nr:hypothetical protein [Leptothoe sp. PORK10 BA2]MEA5463577.1 hypothetical protein [Leptothoe sp. PORK10 BA2]
MKIWRWGWLGLVVAASACGLVKQVDGSPSVTGPQGSPLDGTESLADVTDNNSCGPMTSQVPLQPATDTELPSERFDFRPTTVEATDTTLTFTGKRYEFTFCKLDRTWGIQSLEPAPAKTAEEAEAEYAEYFEALAEPDYETITAQEQSYQARVRLDASWLDREGGPSNNDIEQVVFELIKPGESQPVAKVLYTNTDIIQRELGETAGVPNVTRALATDEALWWSIGFEQGEGASGITTVVQYTFETDEITLWQPTDLGSAQITDLAVTNAETTSGTETTLWLGTQYSGEGNPYLPAKGLVAYSPAKNTVQTYTVENSPLPGAIPTRLWAEGDDLLWVATANGVCEVDWTAIDQANNWDCWRFTAMADLPMNQALYPSLLAETALDRPDGSPPAESPVELLWLADTDITTPESPLRYEISYAPGLTTELSQGAEYYVDPEDAPDEGYFWWPGQDWSWQGQRFGRYWDQVAVNYVGGGPQGIGPTDYETYVADWKIMRGEFELLNLTTETTEITYYSAWIDQTGIEPWVTVTAATNATRDAANPTEAILTELKQAAQ